MPCHSFLRGKAYGLCLIVQVSGTQEEGEKTVILIVSRAFCNQDRHAAVHSVCIHQEQPQRGTVATLPSPGRSFLPCRVVDGRSPEKGARRLPVCLCSRQNVRSAQPRSLGAPLNFGVKLRVSRMGLMCWSLLGTKANLIRTPQTKRALRKGRAFILFKINSFLSSPGVCNGCRGKDSYTLQVLLGLLPLVRASCFLRVYCHSSNFYSLAKAMNWHLK